MFNPQKRNHRIHYAQNFLNNPSLARYLVSLSHITASDTVVEVGPGKGILTHALLAKTHNLILIEKDRELAQLLRAKYESIKTLRVLNIDVMHYKIDTEPYIVFANPPFNILSQVVKRFVFHKNSPSQMYLFMQHEAQKRFCGKPKESQLSILIKSFYTLKELHSFKRTDFTPVPSVGVTLLSFRLKREGQVTGEDKHDYIRFVQYGFQQQKLTLEKNFEKIFSYEQWKRLAQAHKFAPKCAPTDLTPDQWIALFMYFKISISPEKKRIVQSFTPKD